MSAWIACRTPSASNDTYRASIEVPQIRLVVVGLRAGITAPPKPSVQTQFVLTRMDDRASVEDAHWHEVMENLDLLYAKVGSVEQNQQRIEARMEMSGGIMEQMLKDQQQLAKQMEITGQAVAQLTLNQMNAQQPVNTPTHSEVCGGYTGHRRRHQEGENQHFRQQ